MCVSESVCAGSRSRLRRHSIRCVLPQPFSVGHLTSVPLHCVSAVCSVILQLAFYDIALAGVKDCQEMCKAASIPYERPKDYYAEMVKTDEHMLKVSSYRLAPFPPHMQPPRTVAGHSRLFVARLCCSGQEAVAGASSQGGGLRDETQAA